MINSRNQKLLILITNLGRGGAQEIFRQQCRHLANYFDVFPCVFNWDEAFEEDRNSNVISLGVPAGRNWALKIKFFVTRIRKLRRFKKEKGIHFSISHLEGADYVNILSKRNDKTICWIHGTKKHDKNIAGLLGQIRLKLLMPLLYKRADRVVAVSKGIANELAMGISGLEKKITTIYNGFDLLRISQLKEESIEGDFSLLFNQAKIIITHCRLSRQKNLESLIKIFHQVASPTDSKLVILGDGELRDHLILLCSKLGLRHWNCWSDKQMDVSRHVYFLGQQSNPFKFLHHAHLYVMTSKWEGFPLALCEALACGLHVISSDCPTGPKEILAPELDLGAQVENPYRNEQGILMPPVEFSNSRSVDLWANEISNVILDADAKTYPNISGIHRVRQFELLKSVEQTVGLIEGL